MKKRVLALTMAAAMMLTMVGCGSSKKEGYNVGICQFVQHDALDAATKGFMEAMKEDLGDKVTFDEQNASGEPANCATIANQMVANDVDLILGNATPALQAAAAATDSIPIIGTSVTDYATALEIAEWTGVTNKNISGTSDLAPLDQQAAMINELFPEAKDIGILYCSAEPNSLYQANSIREYLVNEYGYNVTDFTFADSNDIASVCTAAVSEVDVLYIPTDNAAAANTSVIDNVCLEAGVPVVAGEAGICQGCGVATLSISYYDIGWAAGKMAVDILVNGKDVSKMEIQTAENVTKQYIASRCEKLGVVIPEGYEALDEA
ncbi:MAG: ABC transporter substrate-binding protein [Lachnospiraceae bacterium]|nr:ABC transporter substrate-binding protein [Lachnospiraceae bacterium]